MKFLEVYHKLKEYDDWKFSISFHYHEDDTPLLLIESEIERITLDHSSDAGFFVTIFTEESLISFCESQWLPHVGEEYITFGSKIDDGVHWIIEFC